MDNCEQRNQSNVGPNHNSRVTPEQIDTLKPGEVFVFGSNLAGRHGRGAAKKALEFGAIYGQGKGLQGNTYAIPTKDENLQVRRVKDIEPDVEEFVDYAKAHPELTFLVTEVGCGLAGYLPGSMAPLFKHARKLTNVTLPERFRFIIRNL